MKRYDDVGDDGYDDYLNSSAPPSEFEFLKYTLMCRKSKKIPNKVRWCNRECTLSFEIRGYV